MVRGKEPVLVSGTKENALRPITLFTGQWADLTLAKLAEMAKGWGYDGLELACWGDHFDVEKALSVDGYCQTRHDILGRYGLKVFAISDHLTSQAVCDPIDRRHKLILPPAVWGDGNPDGVRLRAAQRTVDTARAAKQLGVGVVNGFTGSSIWQWLYAFPPTSEADYAEGYADFASRFGPILIEYVLLGIRRATEVHPTGVCFDIESSKTATKALEDWCDLNPVLLKAKGVTKAQVMRAWGFNFDPSHLAWQLVDPVDFLREFPDRIYHTHMKDIFVDLEPGRTGILGSHLPFGHVRRRWDFRSPGHGVVNFPAILDTLNTIGYQGPLSAEWEDPRMNRKHGAKEATDFLRSGCKPLTQDQLLNFPPADAAFDAAFEKK